jgi:hypothetical protein
VPSPQVRACRLQCLAEGAGVWLLTWAWQRHRIGREIIGYQQAEQCLLKKALRHQHTPEHWGIPWMSHGEKV